MRLHPLQSLVLAALLYVVLAPQFACTAGRAMGGSRLDLPPSTDRLVESGDAMTIPPGTRLVVLLRDGRRVQGIFRDTTSLGDTEYAALWQRWLSSAAHPSIPRPGDSVTLVYEHAERTARLEGYHYRSVLLTLLPGDSLVQIPMASLEALRTADGHSHSGAALAMLDAETILPSRLALMLETSGAVRGISQMELATEVIPSSEIRYLALQRGEHSGVALGAFIGLAAGVALVVIAISSATGPQCAPDLPPGILFGLQQRGLGVSTEPYDRFAGRFIDPARGTDASSRHAAPAP